MAIIETKDLVKIYQDGDVQIHALGGVNISIEKGEFTAIVGPSGSGKTTLLNIIGGLDDPDSGSVLIDGQNITALSDREKIKFRLSNIGFVFQAYNLIPVLSAYENTEFTMLLQGKDQKFRQERTHQLLESVGLKSYMHRKPRELSGGQQQRVAVARALAPHPKFVLADEPTANLDSKSTTNLLDIMANLNQKESTTFVFSTHDQRVIDRAKRIVTLEDGVIVSDERR